MKRTFEETILENLEKIIPEDGVITEVMMGSMAVRITHKQLGTQIVCDTFDSW